MSPVHRRQVIKGAGALGGALLAQKLPLWAHADEPPTASAPLAFVDMSSALTGIRQDVLAAPIPQDNLQLADVYFLALQYGSPQYWSTVLTAYTQYVQSGYSPQQIAQLMLAYNGVMRDDAVGTLSRLTIQMWMFGGWYGGTELSKNKYAGQYLAPSYDTDMVLSGRAYVNGWIWRVAQAHPMGYSQFNFGSWADAPPTLKDYGLTS